jgi:hypothetical protein
MSISPSLSLRQHPNRYAFRAGRNLPDKEFRYLRTVIVTAAVHRGFSNKHKQTSLTFRHWAGVSSHTSFYNLAETCVFVKQSLGFDYCNLINKVPLLPKLRGYFAEFLKESYLAPLSILYLPTCVGLKYKYFFIFNNTKFSRKYDISNLYISVPCIHVFM